MSRRKTQLDWQEFAGSWAAASSTYDEGVAFEYRVSPYEMHWIIDHTDGELLPGWVDGSVTFPTSGAAKAFCEGVEWAMRELNF